MILIFLLAIVGFTEMGFSEKITENDFSATKMETVSPISERNSNKNSNASDKERNMEKGVELETIFEETTDTLNTEKVLAGDTEIETLTQITEEENSTLNTAVENTNNEEAEEELATNQQTKIDEDSTATNAVDTTNMAMADSLNSSRDLVGKNNHEFFVGVQANFNLPLIFNQNTYEVFSGKELAYTPTFGLATAVRLGYTIKQQFGFETGFIFFSRQGQDYEETFSAGTAKRQVKLQYFNIPLVLRYKFKEKKNKKMASPWVINLGAQVDLLQSAVITYNGNSFPLDSIRNLQANDKDYFRATTISGVFGMEREIYFTKFLFLGIGIRTTFSSDINAKDRPVVNDGKGYTKSHNFTFGFTLSLNFAGQL